MNLRRHLSASMVAGALAVALTVSTTPFPIHVAAATSTVITDPRLLAELDRALGMRTEGTAAAPRLSIEVLTRHTAEVESLITRLGGTVVAEAEGIAVQASVPATSVRTIAASPLATSVRWPRRVNTPPRSFSRPEGFGPTQGVQVSSTGAQAWHDSGVTGAGVKVGIIDYFDLSLWNTAEMGPVPDAEHQFCNDSVDVGFCTPSGGIIDQLGGDHGEAVAEIVKDMALDAELYVAWGTTISDLTNAIDWFADNGVTIINRSLGSAYDGPGDGTGPLAELVDHAAFRGITWFNSAGNDGEDAYLRRSVASTPNSYVNFNDGRAGAGTDTWLRVDSMAGSCYFLDGVRWSNDWYLPALQRTDYAVEVWEPDSPQGDFSDHVNPASTTFATMIDEVDASQVFGAPPLEGDDLAICPTNQFSQYTDSFGQNAAVSYLRVRRNLFTPIGSVPDQMEVAISGDAFLELGYYDKAGSAAKPVVDSKNPALVAVGAVDVNEAERVDPFDPNSIAIYSSQGPTTDGRVKPDVSAPSGFQSSVFGQFSGTSSSSPTAAGFAALLQSAGLAAPGAGLAALVKHFATDLGVAGPDNVYGSGLLSLPDAPPPPGSVAPGAYAALPLPQRLLDTRPAPNHVGPAALVGPYGTQSVIDLNVTSDITVPVGGSVTAVALNITSVGSKSTGFVQAYPLLQASNGSTSTINIATAGQARPNFAIVPVGVGGAISIYLQAGGHAVVDLLGYFVTTGGEAVAEGRFVPLAVPERWTDTRGLAGAQLPDSFGGTPRKLAAGETITVPTLAATQVPTVAGSIDTSQVAALVVNVAAVGSSANGFIRVMRPDAGTATHANLNYTPGSASANTAIVPVPRFSATGTTALYTSQRVDAIVDVVGYITASAAPFSTEGMFVPLSPVRVYNTRDLAKPFAAGESRAVILAGGTTGVPSGVSGVSANLAAVAPSANGFLKVYPGVTAPPTASLNFAAGKTVANGALVGVNPDGSATATMSQASHLIIDVNGYFVKVPV
jgi:hypothetical protein